MTISSGILRIFFSHGRQLIPISPDEPHRLKRPLHNGWQEKDYTAEEIQAYVAQGYNLGWRLSATDVVIDVDLRNDGLNGLATLLADFQARDNSIEDLGDVFPTVRTGGGGFHFYASIPDGVKLRNTVERYGKGIEFKSAGRQVIIPGSLHPSGGLYEFDDFSDYDSASTPLPVWLLESVARSETTAKKSAVEGAELTPQQLASVLSQLPATEYSTNEEWFPLMAAAHEATQGAGLDAFIAWSLSDASFAGHDHIIRYRWESFESGKAGNIGAGTLYKEVAKHGGQLPPISIGELPKYGLDHELPPAPEREPVDAPTVVQYADGEHLDKLVGSFHPMTPIDDIRSLLAMVARMDVLSQERYLQEIAKRTNNKVTHVRKALQSERAQNQGEEISIDDVALEVTTHLLQKKFDGGRTLVHGADQRFWKFSETHWTPMDDNAVEHLLLKASYQYRQERPHINTPVSSLMAQSERILRARRAVGQNLHETLDGRPPVVNTRNCEVWIDPTNGDVRVQPHAPESWLTSCLPVDFNPRATCPVFSTALQQMFEPCSDRDDVIRHLWEIIGYIIQPQKDLATWVLFRGEGANGKTVVLNVITALLGDASLNKPIEELDTRRNNHALADLPGKLCVIDEDLDSQTTLPDSTLKKISESKMLTANPKMRPSFKFRNTAIPVFASNPWPRVKDLSNGMRRRAQVFEFRRTFAEHEQDHTLGRRIIENEMGGVLVEALRGFRRLRQRGGWKTPLSCATAHNQWLTHSNTIGEFIGDTLRPGNSTVGFGQLYGTYKLWCTENGYNHQTTKPGFRKTLEALGFTFGHTEEGLVVRNIAVNQVQSQL